MVIIPNYFLVVMLFIAVPAVVFGTPAPQQTDFKVNVTSSTVGSIPHELDLKLTQLPGGHFSEVTGFVVSPEDVVQVRQGENLIVSTSQNLKAQQVTVRNIQGQQVNLLPLPTSTWSLQGLIPGMYTLDVIVDLSSSGILGTYETILAVLEPGQQPLPPTTVINTITIKPPPPPPILCPTNSTLVNGTCINPTPPIPSPPTPCPNITSTNETCTPSPGPLPPPNATIPITPPPNATIPITPPPNATIPITPPPNATNPILPLGPGPGPGPGPNKTQPIECPLDAEGDEVCPPSPIEPGLIPLESPELGNDETPEVGDDDETPPLGGDTGGDDENEGHDENEGDDDDGSNDDSTGDGDGNGNNGLVGGDTFFD